MAIRLLEGNSKEFPDVMVPVLPTAAEKNAAQRFTVMHGINSHAGSVMFW